jgi:hypothetical protein
MGSGHSQQLRKPVYPHSGEKPVHRPSSSFGDSAKIKALATMPNFYAGQGFDFLEFCALAKKPQSRRFSSAAKPGCG